MPVRYLVGAEGGDPAFRTIAGLVTSVLPKAHACPVQGIPHFAQLEPGRFVERVVEFFDGS